MSNQSESTLNSPQAADLLKDDRLERDRHCPRCPTPLMTRMRKCACPPIKILPRLRRGRR